MTLSKIKKHIQGKQKRRKTKTLKSLVLNCTQIYKNTAKKRKHHFEKTKPLREKIGRRKRRGFFTIKQTVFFPFHVQNFIVTYQESNHGDLLKPLDFSRLFSDNPKQSDLCSGKILSFKESQVISGETHCE